MLTASATTSSGLIPRPDPRLVDLSDDVAPYLVSPPAAADPHACRRCRSWLAQCGDQSCTDCALIEATLGAPAAALDVISLYRRPSALRQWLTRYKGRLDGSEPLVPAYLAIVKALMTGFFIDHSDQLAARAPFDCIVVVPSRHRKPPHPLHNAMTSLGLAVPIRTLLRPGVGDCARNKPCRNGFEIAEPTRPQRVYLVDDVYTTGAQLNSAAAALTDAGHQVAAALVMARRVNPEFHPAAADFWTRQTQRPFRWIDGPVISC